MCDRGRGIAADDLGRIFDRFYRAVDARTEPGSGLGLSIVDGNAVIHGAGTIELTYRQTPGGVAIDVSDEGPGVSIEHSEQIFHRRHGSGHGIGVTGRTRSRPAGLRSRVETDVPAQLDTVRSGIVTVMSIDDSPERALLRGRLAGQRRHVLEQLEGLSDENLRRPVLPSGWSCLGLVRHLTLSDERYWFEVVMAGRPLDFWPEGHNADWKVVDDEPAEAVLAQYRAALASSDAIIAGLDLADPPARPEDWWADAGLSFPDLRAVLVHVIVETATHAGQLDAVRELLDGKQYLVL